MRVAAAALCLAITIISAFGATEVYPLRDAKGGEGRESWWWAAFYKPVIVVKGSLAETEKPQPDLSIRGSYETWSKLTAPSLAHEPADDGFYLLLTRLHVDEVLYVDPTLRNCDAQINWMAERAQNDFDCILPAKIKDDDAEGRKDDSQKAYRLDLAGDESVPAGQQYVLIFEYASLYPLDGLYLTDVAELDQLDQIRKICEYRRQHQTRPVRVAALPAEESKQIVAKAMAALNAPKKLALFSLDPHGTKPPYFHGHTVVGEAMLENADGQRSAGRAVLQALQHSDGHCETCFEPKYGIRVQDGNGSFELLISYDCKRVHICADHGAVHDVAITGSPEILDQLIKTHAAPAEH